LEKAYLYVVLTRTNTVISRLIHFFTHDDYTHAALSFDRDLEEMYSFGRRTTYNPFIGRFKRESLDEGIYKISRNLPGVIVEIEVPKERYDEARELLEVFIANRSRYKYNYRGLVYGLFNKPTTKEDRFLCSQFVYYILHNSGIADFHRPSNLVRPQDFLNLPGRIVFQGDLKDLAETEPNMPIRIRVLNWCREKYPFRKVS
jgi:hypothetical protein